ncbi:hypothetical protein [Stutzerimonas nitrititolerans]|uniref:hypothetical protein n=1 Tax=Stutzerimonas nitrititolerans TaxID=2482751 RepID=UPI0028AD7359|nr:hypothetical protein [Stutzerimonas nitrititolerans]
MGKIEVTPSDAENVKNKVDSLVGKNAKYPIQVTLNHKRKPGVVLPIIGVNDILAPDADHKITLWSYQQAWDLVSQIAHIANLFKIEKAATIVVDAPATTKSSKEPEVKA